MRAYAERFGEDEELYARHRAAPRPRLRAASGHGQPTGHPRTALALFRERGYPDELIDAVAGHADFLDVPRESRMAKTLYAVDELSGFVAACALVRPTGIEGLTPKSVKKKLKQPSFAAGVNRDDVRRGAEELGVDFDEHVAFVIAAMEARADELGLAPQRSGLALAPAPAGLGPGGQVRHGAEGVRDAVLAAVPHEGERHVAERLAAVGAGAVPGLVLQAPSDRAASPPSALPASPRAPRAPAGRRPPAARPAARGGASRPRAPPRDRTRNSVRGRSRLDSPPRWPTSCELSSWRATRPARSCSSRRCGCSTRPSRRSRSSSSTTTCRSRTAASTNNEVVSAAAAAMREARFGVKAATVTPEGADDVGSPNRLLREAIDGKVIIRTGPAHPGRDAGGRRALPDRRGAHGGRRRLRRGAVARRGGRRRGRLPHRAHQRAASAAPWPSTASGPRSASTGACTAGPSGP